MRRKSPADKALDAVLRGLDFVPPEQRHEVLAITSGPRPSPVARCRP